MIMDDTTVFVAWRLCLLADDIAPITEFHRGTYSDCFEAVRQDAIKRAEEGILTVLLVHMFCAPTEEWEIEGRNNVYGIETAAIFDEEM